jgi:formylglycine-generating enzyme required for sulfatase activity
MKKLLSLFLLFSVAMASYAATDYGISVAGVRVTSDNASNITGYGISGTVSYYAATNTLTLWNATIDVTDWNICAIATDYGKKDFKIRLLGENYIKTNSNNIAIRISESFGFTIYSEGTSSLDCQGILFLDASDYMMYDWTMSYIKNCTINIDEIWSDDYEECLTIENSDVTMRNGIDVGSDHSGKKSVTLIDCYLAYPMGGYFDWTGGVSVGDDETWYGLVEIKRGGRPGDVNGDGHVNSADITALYDWMLNNNSSNLVNGDANGDGHINSADITCVYDILLGNVQPDNNVTEYTVNGVKFKMINVAGGTFIMGATTEQGSDANSDESPTHQVTLSNFSIGQTEVTQELWKAVMGSNPSYFNGTGNPNYGSSHSDDYYINLQRPVEWVSWDDCQVFIAKLNQMTGKQFRLPTEAEWEYAARGGNKSQSYKYAGSNTLSDVAWYWDNIPSHSEGTAGYGTQSVGMKQPNKLGLYDMSGNVWEWCQDWYGSYSSAAQTNPQGPSSGSGRVYRGGSWDYSAGACRVSCRNLDNAEYFDYDIGLRLAM